MTAPLLVTAGKALIIGYGNPLRGDDAAGQMVAQSLADEAAIDGATVVVCHQLTPELAEQLSAVELAVFIDAAADVPPGSVNVTRIHGAAGALGHHADPRQLLGLAKRLYGSAPDAFLVAIGAASFELGAMLSEPVATALPHAIAAIRRLILQHRSVAQ